MHDLTPMFSLGAASLGIAAAVGLWLLPATSGRALADTAQADLLALPGCELPPGNLAELRARGPAGLDDLLARYDRLSLPASATEGDGSIAGMVGGGRHDSLARGNPRGAPDPDWEAAIDTVAAQRYALSSRLYWFTDLDRARHEAHRRHRPILALRMLGDLRDDLSCANSRLFRTTLYANTSVSAFLRENFVLYWSSERAVPRVTIDYGDGRKLVRTITGNSAHYVLDEDGHVLDVLPGLYAPQVFQAELTRSLALAAAVRGMTDAARIDATVAYHAAAIAATDRDWERVQGTRYIRRSPFLEDADPVVRAQLQTMSKMVIEVPDLQAIRAIHPGEAPDDSAAWSAIGQKIWNITERAPSAPGPARPSTRAVPRRMVLDAASTALVTRIHNAGPAEQRATASELDAVLARLEQHIVADTALDQFRLRPAIRRYIASERVTDFATLNAWVYEVVFVTPRADPWLGLRARTDFTGLPGDGVVMP